MKQARGLVKLLFLSVMVCAYLSLGSRCGQAQSMDTSIQTTGQQTGITPSSVYDTKSESIDLENGNVFFSLPLMSLKSARGGFDLAFTINTKAYVPYIGEVPYNPDNGTQAYGRLSGWRENFPIVDSPGLPNLNIPFLDGSYGVWATTTVQSPETGNLQTENVYCTYGLALVDATGARHPFQNVYGCQGSELHPEMETPTSESYDGTLSKLDTSNPADIVLSQQNGSVTHFTSNGQEQITDANGNRTTIANTGGNISITDPLNRSIAITRQDAGYLVTGPDENGQTRTVTITKSSLDEPVTMSGTCPDSNNQNMPTFLSTFSGGVRYTITYSGSVPRTYIVDTNGAGELTKVSLPTGGYIRYEYSDNQAPQRFTGHYVLVDCTSVSHREISARYVCSDKSGSCSHEDVTTYTPTFASQNWGENLTMDVTTIDGLTHHVFQNFWYEDQQSTQETNETDYQGSSVPLRKVDKQYYSWDTSNSNYYHPQLQQATTSLYGSNTVSGITTYAYASRVYTCPSYQSEAYNQMPCTAASGKLTLPSPLVSSIKMYGFDSTLLLDDELQWTGYDDTSAYHLGLLQSERVSGARGAYRRTDYEYDVYRDTIQASQASNLVAMSNERGNRTAVTKYAQGDQSPLMTIFNFDDAGNVIKVTDPRNYSTVFGFADAWSSICNPAVSNAKAFPTSETDALGHVIQHEYNFCTGTSTATVDSNHARTSYQYDDFGRMTRADYPDGGWATIQRSDTSPATAVTTQALSPNLTVVSGVDYDGLGRPATNWRSEGSGGRDIVTDLTYDPIGRPWITSNPYRPALGGTSGATTTTYDALSRVVQVIDADGTSTNRKIYSANQISIYDENNNYSTQTYDAAGHLTEVAEHPASGTINTQYTYNGLGDLLSLTQSGTGSESPRVRSFSYDSLSRLLTSTNPETGTICYGVLSSGPCGGGYDPNGNLRFKTDSRGILATYTYDGLNRLTSKSYSDGTPSAGFGYDGKDEGGNPLSVTVDNAVGRLSHTSNEVNAAADYSYDSMGRLKFEAICVPSDCSYGKQVSATYDLAGNLTSMTYPDGRVIGQTYDPAGRMSSVSYQSWGGTYVNQPYFTATAASGYDAAGHLVNGSFGNNVSFGTSYDNRQRQQSLFYGPTTAPLWSKQYSWTPNSNLQSDTDLITGVQRQFAYDNLNRLTSAQDIFSNLAVPSGSNNNTGSTSSSGSAATETVGTTGATPWLTDPDDSNLLSELAAPDGTWALSNANLTATAAIAPDGTDSAARVDATSGSNDTYIAGAVVSPYLYSGETMSGSVWLRSTSGTMNVELYIVDDSSSGWGVTASRQAQLTTTWQQFQLTGATPNNITSLKLQIGGGGSVTSGQSFLIWNPLLEDQGAAGTSVTNYALYSQRFSKWNPPSQGTVVDNSALAPDGTNTAATLMANSGATDSYVAQPIADPAPFSGVAVTGSVWLRVPSGSAQVLLTFFESNADGSYLTGAQTITLSSTWQRFQIAGTTASNLNYLVFQIGGGSTFVNGQVIYAWGAQIELASVAGPYVATGATPATASTSLTNILEYSQKPTGPSWSGTYGFTGSSNSVVAPDGSTTGYEATAAGNVAWLTNDVPNQTLYNTATATASVYLRVPNGTGAINFYLIGENASGRVLSQSVNAQLTTTWQRFSVTAQLPNGMSRLFIQIGDSQTAGQVIDVWGSQMELNGHAGPYVATSDLPVIAGSQPTNILPSSQALNGAHWSDAAVSVASNTATAPDGSNTAAVVTAASGSSDSYLVNDIPNPSLYDNETVTASIYLRVSSGSSMNLSLFLLNQGDQGWGGTGQTVTVTDTWQRFTISNNNQNGLTRLYLQIGGAGTLSSLQSIQIWGPQMVVGSDASSYVPTSTGTTVYATSQSATLVPNGLNETYAYDSFGNILQNGAFNTTYTPNNQMFGYAYDAAGNLQSDGVHGAMTWDAENRIVSASGATYIYDAEGNRVEKQGVGITDTINFGGRSIARLSAGQWTDLVYGPTGLLAEVPGVQTGAPTYRVTDHLGTTVGNLTSDGRFINPADYKPFGQVFSGNTSDPYLFTGKERDLESGLDYFGARYYASSMGRFMSPDWAAKAEPVPYAKLDNPQSLNLYEYVLNNPLRGVDPDGHCSAPTVQGGHVGICLESYIQVARFGLFNMGHGDARGPVGNDPNATFRTQTMIDVNLGSQSATEKSRAGMSVTDTGSRPGVVNDWISDPQKGSDGSTTFTVHVYGENGYEAAHIPGAPGGWIEMVYTLKVAADGTVSVVSASTKDFPSVSIYSYQSDGAMKSEYQQKESGNVNDLNKPRKSRTPNPGFCSAEFASCN